MSFACDGTHMDQEVCRRAIKHRGCCKLPCSGMALTGLPAPAPMVQQHLQMPCSGSAYAQAVCSHPNHFHRERLPPPGFAPRPVHHRAASDDLGHREGVLLLLFWQQLKQAPWPQLEARDDPCELANLHEVPGLAEAAALWNASGVKRASSIPVSLHKALKHRALSTE